MFEALGGLNQKMYILSPMRSIATNEVKCRCGNIFSLLDNYDFHFECNPRCLEEHNVTTKIFSTMDCSTLMVVYR